jgi:signal transduction histidine kinase
LLDGADLTPKARDFLRVGQTELDRQDVLIRTILDVFTDDIASLERSDDLGSVDVIDCAREVVTSFSPLCVARGIALELDMQGEPGPGWRVPADRARLVRVFANLVENALRHSRRGAVVQITIALEVDDVVVGVEDEGPGVDPQLARRLFDRFAQVGGRAGNVGLGLHFCRITVERWGGAIGHENRERRGSRFWFRLPRVEGGRAVRR